MRGAIVCLGLIFTVVFFVLGCTKTAETTSAVNNENVQREAITPDTPSQIISEEKSGGENMRITSPAFEDNGMIPSEYTCEGDDISPPLAISNVPEGAQSLALIVDDPDAPMGTWVHWVVFNIPPATTGISKGESVIFPQGRNDFGKLDYGGPCPPSGVHRYFFKLYALDAMLNLSPGATKRELEAAMEDHIIGEAQLIGKYSRS